MAFSPNSKLLGSSSWDRTIRLWSADERKLKHILANPDQMCSKIFVRDSVLVASTGDAYLQNITVRVWDTEKGEVKHTFKCDLEGYAYVGHLLDCSSDGRLVAVALVYNPSNRQKYDTAGPRHPQGIDLWDTEKGERKNRVLYTEGAQIRSISFSSKGELIVLESFDRCLRLWNAGKKIEERIFDDLLSGYRVAISPNSRFIALVSKQAIWSWDKESEKWECGYENRLDRLPDIILSSKGMLAANGFGDREITLYKTRQDEEKRALKGHSNYVTSFAFSPDSQLLASAAFEETVKIPYVDGWEEHGRLGDSTVRLWDVDKGEEHCMLEVHSYSVNHVAFSPNGEFLTTASDDGMVGLWNISKLKKQPKEESENRLSLTSSSSIEIHHFGREPGALICI